MSTLHRRNRVAYFFASLAGALGISVVELGELTLDEVRRRHRS